MKTLSSHSFFGGVDMSIYLKQLKENDPSLHSVDLSTVYLSNEELTPFVSALKENTSLKFIRMRMHIISPSLSLLFEEVLKSNYTICEIKPSSGRIAEYAKRNKLLSSVELVEQYTLDEISALHRSLRWLTHQCNHNRIPTCPIITANCRLVQGLKELQEGQLIHALNSLAYSFENTFLQNIAEKNISEALLLLAPDIQAFPADYKLAFYQLMAYNARNNQDLPAFHVGLAGMRNPHAEKGVSTERYAEARNDHNIPEQLDYNKSELLVIRRKVKCITNAMRTDNFQPLSASDLRLCAKHPDYFDEQGNYFNTLEDIYTCDDDLFYNLY